MDTIGRYLLKCYTLTYSPNTLAGCSPPILSLFRRFIESQLFCLPELHPRIIRNESYTRSFCSTPSQSLQTESAAHKTAPDFSHASNSPTLIDVGNHPYSLHSSDASWVPPSSKAALQHWSISFHNPFPHL